MKAPDTCQKCGSQVRASIADVGIQFECATIVVPTGGNAEGLPCITRQRDQLAERVKRLKEAGDKMAIYAQLGGVPLKFVGVVNAWREAKGQP